MNRVFVARRVTLSVRTIVTRTPPLRRPTQSPTCVAERVQALRSLSSAGKVVARFASSTAQSVVGFVCLARALAHVSLNEPVCSDAVPTVDEMTFHDECEATLDHIAAVVEAELEASDELAFAYDVNYEDGVVTLALGPHGTYVINKQTPNRQIWWSSPRRFVVNLAAPFFRRRSIENTQTLSLATAHSGPMRFQFNTTRRVWENVRDPSLPTLLELLGAELASLLANKRVAASLLLLTSAR